MEDDFARLLGHGGGTPRPLVQDDPDGTVVYVTSLTKPAAPSLRIGALVARGPVMERMRAMRMVDDFFVARPLQEAALELLGSPSWERHLRALAVELRDRAGTLAAAVARHCPEWSLDHMPTGGLHLWLRLPSRVDAATVAADARRHGVAVDNGNRFFAAEPDAAFLRMTHAATTDREELLEGARRLERIDATPGPTAKHE